MNFLLRPIIVIALVLLLGQVLHAQTPDAFNPDANGNVFVVAGQADDKVLVGGSFTFIGGQARNRLARFHADGMLDAGFNPGANGSVWHFAVQTDGKVLVGGSFTSIGGQTRNNIARLNPDGSASSGMSITIADSAAMDIHTAIPMSGGTVTGTYQPDGRNTDPLVVLDTDSRPAMLSSFTGLDASGSWTLFVADQSAGDQSTLESWSLTITGVPEPSSALLLITSSLLLARRRR